MKKLSAILLCLAFAAGAAEAKTLYVNASRPNNNGNGLKPATAKKTIQAAINVAKAGDTILVYPGTYAPIKTNNKKIAIKSVNGASKTKIVKTSKIERDAILAQLGTLYDDVFGRGRKSALSGFLLDGLQRNLGSGATLTGILGGTVKSCVIQRLGEKSMDTDVTAVMHSTLKACTIKGNYGRISESSDFSLCKIVSNAPYGEHGGWSRAIDGGMLCNCLVAGNKARGPIFSAVTAINCTIVQNSVHLYSDDERFSEFSYYYNCILRNNRRDQVGTIHNVDALNGYSRTYVDNRDPKFVNVAKGDYRLQKSSPCINVGKLNATLKKLVGSYDLAGRKRINGKAIDLGCYEY